MVVRLINGLVNTGGVPEMTLVRGSLSANMSSSSILGAMTMTVYYVSCVG